VVAQEEKTQSGGHTIKVGGDVRRIVICGRLSDRGKQVVIRNCLWSNFPLSVAEDKANSLIANNLCRQTGRLVQTPFTPAILSNCLNVHIAESLTNPSGDASEAVTDPLWLGKGFFVGVCRKLPPYAASWSWSSQYAFVAVSECPRFNMSAIRPVRTPKGTPHPPPM
jgi:hypothetical protein